MEVERRRDLRLRRQSEKLGRRLQLCVWRMTMRYSAVCLPLVLLAASCTASPGGSTEDVGTVESRDQNPCNGGNSPNPACTSPLLWGWRTGRTPSNSNETVTALTTDD